MKKKKTAKRLVLLPILILLLITVLAACTADEPQGVDTSAGGRQFTELENIAMDKALTEIPLTFEAWVKLPAGYTERGGAIVSNYRGTYDWCDEGVAMEIYENGKPRLYLDNGSRACDAKFDVNIATGEWTHVAITIDLARGLAECFVNGETVGTSYAMMGLTSLSTDILSRPFMIGGSYERYNPQYFKGEIGTVELFSEVRSAEDIKRDYERGVADSTSALLAKIDLFGGVGDKFTDLSGNGNNVTDKMFLDSDEYTPVTDFAYSLAIVGDTQRVNEIYPDALDDIYRWIADNAEREKIQFVIGVGDITEQSKVIEWENAKAALKILEDAGIPYSLARGNHDMKTTNPADQTRLGMNDVFGNYVNYTSQFGGFYGDDITNSWRTQTIGEIDYLFITLDYGASDDMLKWASEVVSAHSEHKVIITTHGYEYYSGNKLGFSPGKGTVPAAANDYEFKKYADNPGVRDYNSAVDMWNDFASKHENIFLILSGHEGADDIIYHTETGVHGNAVTSFLINPQGADDKFGGVGTVCLFKFSADGKTIYIEYYSVMKEAYFKSVNQITLTLSDN